MPAVARLQGEPQVLVDREALEEIGDLARAREPAPGNGVGRQAADVAAVQLPRATVRPIEPGNQVEGGGLAVAVGAYARSIGRATCRERVCTAGEIAVVDVSLNKKIITYIQNKKAKKK